MYLASFVRTFVHTKVFIIFNIITYVPSIHSIRYIRSFVSTNEGTFVYLRFIRLLIGRELDHLQKS